MTRVHQALERAREIGADTKSASKPFRANPDGLGIWDFADQDVARESKRSPVPVIPTRWADGSSTAPVKDRRENVDARPHTSVRRSWLKRMKALAFWRRARDGRYGAVRPAGDVFSNFLPPADGRRFDELMHELANAEKEKSE
jgi:hypothetical protein